MLLPAVSAVVCMVVVVVLADPNTDKICTAPKVSTFRVSLRNLQNNTGHWNTQVAFKQGQSEAANEWLADIDQNVLTCEGQESTLETVVNLRAPPTGSSPLGSSAHWFSDLLTSCSPTPASPPKVAPKDYELFPGVGYYKFHPESLKWPQARKVCTAEGGQLIILNSQAEVDIAVKILARHPSAGDWFLTGILEMGVHAEWFTLFGVPLEKSGYYQIYPGENNAPGPSDFGSMHRSGPYADQPLGVAFPFICEAAL